MRTAVLRDLLGVPAGLLAGTAGGWAVLVAHHAAEPWPSVAAGELVGWAAGWAWSLVPVLCVAWALAAHRVDNQLSVRPLLGAVAATIVAWSATTWWWLPTAWPGPVLPLDPSGQVLELTLLRPGAAGPAVVLAATALTVLTAARTPPTPRPDLPLPRPARVAALVLCVAGAAGLLGAGGAAVWAGRRWWVESVGDLYHVAAPLLVLTLTAAAAVVVSGGSARVHLALAAPTTLAVGTLVTTWWAGQSDTVLAGAVTGVLAVLAAAAWRPLARTLTGLASG